MRTQSSTITVADYCQGLLNREYFVNKDYQRSDKVWPAAAKSFLIETILLDFPIPKLSLHQRLDLKTRTTVKHIVDGQQRSRAILDFYEDKFRLSRGNVTNAKHAGRLFSGLDTDDQAQFLDYGLNFDIFVGASTDDVREVFRRMNSFTVPLNPEESRHANFQGPFKWYIHGLSRDYDRALEAAGVFTEKQINRMVDAKWLTEVSHALLRGITTTNKTSLDKLYRDFDKQFNDEAETDAAVRHGLDQVLGSSTVQGTSLTKPYNLYSLCLAYIQADGQATVVEEEDLELPDVPDFEEDDPDYNLSLLADAIDAAEDADENDEEDEDDPYAAFIAATKERTNVKDQRTTRFEYFLAALTA